MSRNQHKYCAAVHFGPAFIRFAFCTEWNEHNHTYLWDCDWPPGIELQAPSDVLLNPDGFFLAVGFEAAKIYSKYDDLQKATCFYFKGFVKSLQLMDLEVWHTYVTIVSYI